MRPPNPGVDGVLLCLTDHPITFRVKLGQAKRPTSSWVSGVLLCFADQGYSRCGWAKRPANPWVGRILLFLTDLLQDKVRLGMCYKIHFVTRDVL